MRLTDLRSAGRYDRVVLSPHFDDAALSLGGSIAAWTSAGEHVLVITVCAGVPSPETPLSKLARGFSGNDAAAYVGLRRQEDAMAMDLFGIAACLARTTRAIERRGEEGARREIDMTTIFTNLAHKRLRQHVADFQKNDDELRKAAAVRAYTDRAYPFDIL